MSLIDEMKTTCKMMDKVTIPDGQGGFITRWVEGASFQAAIIKDSTLNARIAEKEGVTEVYTITVGSSVSLDFHDVFKRTSDNTVFRVMSNKTDSTTPSVASFTFGQVTAEKWEIPS